MIVGPPQGLPVQTLVGPWANALTRRVCSARATLLSFAAGLFEKH